MEVLDDILRDIDADADADDAFIARPFARREGASVLTLMLESRAAVLRFPPLVLEAAALQRRIVRFWADADDGRGLREWVRRRSGHLIREDLVDGEVDLAIRRMRWAFNDLQFFVAFASMRMLAFTARRLSADMGTCLWGCAAVGGDDLRHYLACPLPARFSRSNWRHPPQAACGRP